MHRLMRKGLPWAYLACVVAGFAYSILMFFTV